MNGMSIQTWDEWFLVHPMGSHGNPNRGTRYAMHQNPHGKAKLKTVIYLQRTHIVVCIYNMYLCMHIYIYMYIHAYTHITDVKRYTNTTSDHHRVGHRRR